MAKIDLEKLICSLAKRKYFSEEKLQGALKEQGLEYKDGEIVESQRPKFKVGDWITDGKALLHITKFETDYGYELKAVDGEVFHFVSSDLVETNYYLWTIQDAKDGDVLACGDKVTDCPFIFHNLTENLNPRSYCGVNTLCDFQENDENGGSWCDSEEVRPATKEQRDFLFSKMHEDGYEWNADKKELEKVEPADEIGRKFKVGDIVQYITDSTDRRKIVGVDTLCDMYTTDSSPIMFEVEDEWKVVVNAEDIEQNPAPEPKFKVGDWIVSKYMHLIMQILNNDNGSYKTLETDGTERNDSYDFIERNFKLWSIEDAKEGDVLVNGSNIFIFHFINATRLMGYCHVNTDDGRFYDDIGKNECFCLIDAVVTPATNAQRDLLFQKMKEAGYEWDAEKKDLKKIGQKPIDMIEPKFKVGDWILSSVLGIAHIIGVNDSNEYQLEYIDGKQKFSSIDYVNYEYDKWSIQDAKDGDVLALISGQCIFLFDGNNKEYCHYSKITDNFSPNYDYMGFIQHQFVPATKEQRELLFQKMKEAGYEWDADKKELKKIEKTRPMLSDFFNAENERGKASFANRQLYNRAILAILSNYVEKYPDIRFGQMLFNLDIKPHFDEESREAYLNLSKAINKRK